MRQFKLRKFFSRAGFIGLGIITILASECVAQSEERLAPWQKGFLDIHHISTGRGNAAYLIFPDGTTLLIDAGDISETHPRTVSPRNSTLKPNRNKTAPEWIADYIRSFAPQENTPVLDYALITHYHDDHFGEWDETRQVSSNGAYSLTGIMAVGDQIPILNLIDRGFDFPIDLKGKEFAEKSKDDEYHILQTLLEYWKFIDWHKANSNLRNEVLKPGSKTQIQLQKSPDAFPSFSVRNIAVNGSIWTGFADDESFSLFQPGQYHGENPLSTCIKISYGNFDYFTGGDISGVDGFGEGDINSVESHVAPVVGAVDIATLNHHGNRDSHNAYYVRTLRPRVWIGQSWSSDHPGHDVLRRITTQNLYPGDRDLFATDMLESNELVIGDMVQDVYGSIHGHVVVRVDRGGDTYHIYILDDSTEIREVVRYFGPYTSR